MKHTDYLYLLVSLLFILSCGNSKPKGLLNKEEFTSILVDIHILDAVASDYLISSISGNLDSAVIYAAVLEKHKIDYTIFCSSLNYYTSKPELFKDIYDKVYTEITKNVEYYANQEKKISMSESVWSLKKSMYIKGDTAKYPDPFVVPIDTTGTYILKFSLRLQPTDKAVNPNIIAYFFKDSLDIPDERIYFKKVPLIKTKYSREFQIEQEIIDSTYRFLSIQIPACENRDSIFYKDISLNNFHVYYSKKEKN